MTATTYAKVKKARYPTSYFSDKENKIIESAQNGIATEAQLRAYVAAANPGDVIVLAPCTITLAQQLVIDKPLRFRGCSQAGVSGTQLYSTYAGAAISIEMTATNGASACEVAFENINFQHSVATKDVIAINNTNMAAALTVTCKDSNINVLAATAAFAIIQSQSTAGQAVNITVTGRYKHTCDAVSLAVKNAGNRYVFEGVQLQLQGKSIAITSSTDNKASQLKLIRCQVPESAATDGGHASQLLISVGSISLTGTTFAAADTNDYTGSQTETII